MCLYTGGAGELQEPFCCVSVAHAGIWVLLPLL
jgi:hypothetical protein